MLRLALLGVVLFVVGGLLVTGGFANSDYLTGVGYAPRQPVPFNHAHHVGELGIDCRYCHGGVETSAEAGLPPTYTCMTCHSQIFTGAKMLAPVRDSMASDTPLHWARVAGLPDYVYFNHSIHIAKGVGCSSCHGPVDRMQLTRRKNAFHMSFCLDCHRAPEKYVRPADQVWNTEWIAPPDQTKKGRALVAANHIDTSGRLTDCTTCHR